MDLELYFAPGACSFVPHVALEAVKAATGQAFEPKLVKLHKGEHKTPEYLALNPDGVVPTLIVDGAPITDPNRITEGTYVPVGGYKGSGLSLIIGLLAGPLNRANFGRDISDFAAPPASAMKSRRLTRSPRRHGRGMPAGW